MIDEPSVGLALILVDQVIRAIRELQRSRNLTILMAEQSFFQTIEIAAELSLGTLPLRRPLAHRLGVQL